MARTAFIFLLLVCSVDLGPMWLRSHRSLLLPPVAHGRTVVAANPHDLSLFSRTPPLSIISTNRQGSPRPQQLHQVIPDHLSANIVERRRLRRRIQLDPNFVTPKGAPMESLQAQSAAISTSTASTTPLGSTSTSSALTLAVSSPTSTPTLTPTPTLESESNYISNVLSAPMAPSPRPSNSNNTLGGTQKSQQNSAQPSQLPSLGTQETRDSTLAGAPSSINRTSSALSLSSMVILSVAILAVTSLVVIGGVVIVHRRRYKRANAAGLEHIEGGRGSVVSETRRDISGEGGGGGRKSWTKLFGRKHKGGHYGLHSFNSSGDNALPEQFWNPE